MRRYMISLVAFFGLAFGLAACGSGDDGPDPSETGTGGSGGTQPGGQGGTGDVGGGGGEDTGGTGGDGSDGGSGGGPSVGTCVSGTWAGCKECFVSNCKASCDAFMADDVQMLDVCIRDCGVDEPDCVAGCGIAFSDFVAPWTTFAACFRDSCSEACTAAVCPSITGDAVCDSCLDGKCAAECTQATKHSFSTYYECLMGCGENPTCVEGCVATHPEIEATTTAFSACYSGTCHDDCGCFFASAAEPCGQCVLEHCRSECVTISDRLRDDLNDYMVCMSMCEDEACGAQCTTDYPEAAAVSVAFDECTVANCTDICDF